MGMFWDFIRNRCPKCKEKGTVHQTREYWETDDGQTYGVRVFTCERCKYQFEQTGKTEPFR